jgi:hypothetical protein
MYALHRMVPNSVGIGLPFWDESEPGSFSGVSEQRVKRCPIEERAFFGAMNRHERKTLWLSTEKAPRHSRTCSHVTLCQSLVELLQFTPDG